MIFKQYYLGYLAHASYLIGEQKPRTAAIIDPQRDIDQYLKEAGEQKVEIRYVFLTHFHADFLRDILNSEIAWEQRSASVPKPRQAFPFGPSRMGIY